MSAMLFVDAPLARFPKGTRRLFPIGTKVQDVTAAIMKKHPAIAGAFFTGVGHRCQFLESQILVEVLRVLMSMDVTALPIHDAILVPASKVALAKDVMLHTFKRKTDQDGVVDVNWGKAQETLVAA
jgi:hypothetical protein